MSVSSSQDTVLVTGASSGIGRELVHCFGRGGHHCIVLARREEKLRALADELEAAYDTNAHVLVADLSQPDSAETIVAELEQRDLTVDVLVNNAGFGARGEFATLPREEQTAMIQVNVATLTELTRELLPAMLERDRGGILNVASTAAFQPGPYMSVYYATKSYVLSFSEGLAEEVSESNVTVTCLAPGPTRTAFVDKADMDETRLFQWGTTMSAKAVAQAGYKGFRRGEVLTIPGWPNTIGAFMVRFTPRALARKVTAWLNR